MHSIVVFIYLRKSPALHIYAHFWGTLPDISLSSIREYGSGLTWNDLFLMTLVTQSAGQAEGKKTEIDSGGR